MPPLSAPTADPTKAMEAFRAHASMRLTRLDMLDRFVEGTQYDGRVHFFDDSDTPLLERAPYIVFQTVQSAIRSHSSMVLGQGRFPLITTNPGENDEEEDESDGAGADSDDGPKSSKKKASKKTKPGSGSRSTSRDPSGFGLDEDDSATIDRFIRKISKQVKLPLAGAKDLRAAMGCGTSVAIVHVKKGKLEITIAHAKHCEAKRESTTDPDEITSLEIQYPYLDPYKREEDGKPAIRCKLYRRVIDTMTDTVYEPLDAPDTGRTPTLDSWKIKQQVKHGFGFCPVRWYKYMAREDGTAKPDGHAIHELILDEITALDFSVSQRHRAVLYTSDPIITEIGVDPGYSPTKLIEVPNGSYNLSREASAKLGPEGRLAETQNGMYRQPNKGAGKMGRKRAPGMAYQYPQGATVSFMTLPGDALKASSDWATELETKIKEWLSWVPLDPATMAGSAALSGKALEMLLKRQVDYDLEVRTDYGDHGLLPLIDLLLRVAYTIGKDPARRKGFFLDGLDEALPILKRFEREQELASAVEVVTPIRPASPGYGQRPELGPGFGAAVPPRLSPLAAGSGAGPSGTAAAPPAAPAPMTTTVWMSPEIDLVWGDFFPSTAVDQKAIGDNIRADLGSGLITKATAVTALAPFYDIKDAAGYVETLKEEEDQKTADLHAANALLAPPGQPGAAPAGPSAPPGQPRPPALPRAPAVKPKPAPPSAVLPPGRMTGGSRTRNAPALPVS